MKSTTLVIMAAGIGSRFGGGIKQLEPVGPNGEIIMDYSIHDALNAGFNKVVFIIRRDLEKDFKEVIGNRISNFAPVSYAYQELNDLPDGFSNTWGRTKPWGTGQAVLSAKGIITDPFVVINADDYYGKEAFCKIHDYLVADKPASTGVYDICMAGFLLSNTLSENGGVTRGICDVDGSGYLIRVTETYEIRKNGDHLTGKNEAGDEVQIPDGKYVSMNMWGMLPEFIEELDRGFTEFLRELKPDDKKSEYLLPKIIDRLLREKKASVKVLESSDRWFGVTYQEDKEIVVREIKKLVSSGEYPDNLYKK